MIIIIGTIEAIRKAAAERKIDIPPDADGVEESAAPFTRRRLSHLRKGQIFRGLGPDPAQAVMITALDEETPLRIIFPEAEGDTEISMDPLDLPRGNLADLLSGIVPLKAPDPRRGRHIDIQA